MVEYGAGKTYDRAGTLQFNPGYSPPVQVRKVYFDYASTTIFMGTIMDYVIAADPRDGFKIGPGVDVIVNAATTKEGKARIAGVVISLGATDGVRDGWIVIAALIPGQIYTFAVAVNVAQAYGLKLSTGQAWLDDSGTYAITDLAIALYDENDANNPHGVDAINATVGLVEGLYTGYDLVDTA